MAVDLRPEKVVLYVRSATVYREEVSGRLSSRTAERVIAHCHAGLLSGGGRPSTRMWRVALGPRREATDSPLTALRRLGLGQQLTCKSTVPTAAGLLRSVWCGAACRAQKFNERTTRASSRLVATRTSSSGGAGHGLDHRYSRSPAPSTRALRVREKREATSEWGEQPWIGLKFDHLAHYSKGSN